MSASLQLVIKRMLRNWRLLITAILGVTVAVALLSSGPPYASAVTEFGLRRALRNADPADSQLRFSAFVRNLDPDRHAGLDGLLVARLQERLGPWLRGVVRSMVSRSLVPAVEGETFPGSRVNLVFYEWLDEQVRLVAGELPGPYGASPTEVLVAVSAQVAENLGLTVGSRLSLAEGEDREPTAWARVTGIVEANDPHDPYWFGRENPLPPLVGVRWDYQAALLVHRDAFFHQVMALYPKAGVNCTWGVLLNLTQINPGNWEGMQAGVAALQADPALKEAGLALATTLPDILEQYQNKATISRAVLLVLIVEITLLVLYYTAMTSSMIVRQQSKEITVLKSRGGSNGQVGAMQIVEAGLVCLAAVVAGPFLAVGFVQMLPHWGPFAGLSAAGGGNPESAAPTFVLSPQVVWLAAAAALFCWLALVLPALSVARRTVVTFQQALARPPRASVWHRYYLDLFLVVVGGVAFWQLRSYGTVVARTFWGGLRIDPVLLVSPALLMLAGALVFLRVIPWLLALSGRVLGRTRGVSLAVGMWHLARNPVHYSRLVLLLSLAVALGLFSAGFGATLSRSHTEQARYAAGADLRLSTRQPLSDAAYRALPGAAEVSLAYRVQATSQGARFSRAQLLAADLTLPGDGQQPSFLQVTSHYRPDFGAEPLEVLLGKLAADTATLPGVELPGQPAAIGMWVYARPDWEATHDWLAGDSDVERVLPGMKLLDAKGVYFRVALSLVPDMTQPLAEAEAEEVITGSETLQDPGWRYLRAGLAREDGNAPAYPVRLVSLFFKGNAIHRWFEEPVREFEAELNLDDLTVEQADGQVQVVQDFEGLDVAFWQPISQGIGAGGPLRPVSFVRDTKQARAGGSSLNLEMSFWGGRSALGLAVADQLIKPTPIALLVSDKFLADSTLDVGDPVRLSLADTTLTFQIVGMLHYFPTLYNTNAASFAVCNRDRLLVQLNAYPETIIAPNEVWVETTPEADGVALAAQLAGQPGVERVWQEEELRRDLSSEPLSLGLHGLLVIGYAVALILSIVGFTVYFGLTARQRTVEFGVLRSIGLSPAQLLALLSIEQAVLIGLGLAVGTGLGVVLSRLILPFMSITFGGQEVVPPFLPVVDWSALQGLYATLLLTFALAFAAATVALWRMRVHRVLKIGEE